MVEGEILPSIISDVMSSPVIMISHDAKAIEGAKIMAEKKIGSIIIIEDGKGVGIVTERDILEKLVARGKDPSKVMMNEIMSSPLITIKGDSNIFEAIRMIRRHNIRRLVVMEGDHIIGIVTEKDIFRACTLAALASFQPFLQR